MSNYADLDEIERQLDESLQAETVKNVELAAENKRLRVENTELVNALRAVYSSIRDDRFQQFHDVRRLADTMGIYHEDLDGVRVVAQVVERALAKHKETL